jgi:hypothetical protein
VAAASRDWGSRRRGRSGLHRAGCWREPGRSDLTDRATESRPPMAGPGSAQARVKRCGKSAPSPGATSADGNPHPEQGRAEEIDGPSGPRGHSSGRPQRWMVTQPDSREGPVDRIPPTGRLTSAPPPPTRIRGPRCHHRRSVMLNAPVQARSASQNGAKGIAERRGATRRRGRAPVLGGRGKEDRGSSPRSLRTVGVMMRIQYPVPPWVIPPGWVICASPTRRGRRPARGSQSWDREPPTGGRPTTSPYNGRTAHFVDR